MKFEIKFLMKFQIFWYSDWENTGENSDKRTAVFGILRCIERAATLAVKGLRSNNLIYGRCWILILKFVLTYGHFFHKVFDNFSWKQQRTKVICKFCAILKEQTL